MFHNRIQIIPINNILNIFSSKLPFTQTKVNYAWEQAERTDNRKRSTKTPHMELLVKACKSTMLSMFK